MQRLSITCRTLPLSDSRESERERSCRQFRRKDNRLNTNKGKKRDSDDDEKKVVVKGSCTGG